MRLGEGLESDSSLTEIAWVETALRKRTLRTTGAAFSDYGKEEIAAFPRAAIVGQGEVMIRWSG
jgi:hypothetical protein